MFAVKWSHCYFSAVPVDRHLQATCSRVSKILREERLRQRLSLAAVAEKAGISYQMVGYVEQEKRNPTLDTLLRICSALDLDLATVIRRANRAVKQK